MIYEFACLASVVPKGEGMMCVGVLSQEDILVRMGSMCSLQRMIVIIIQMNTISILSSAA